MSAFHPLRTFTDKFRSPRWQRRKPKSNGAGGRPPGLAKKLYNVGYRFPTGYNGFTPYNQIPYDLRQQYRLDPYGRYVYDQNYIYRVDPTSMIVSQVLKAILR